MARKVRYKQAKEDFKERYEVDPRSKCWVWKSKAFRFRVGEYVHNPRRFAVYASGGVIPVGRHVTNGCMTENCVNPEHTVLRHNGACIPKDTQLLLEIEDIPLGSFYLRHRYQRSMEEMRTARRATLLKIIAVRQTSGGVEEVAERLSVSPAFVQAARKITKEEFNDWKIDPLDNGCDPDELDTDMPPDGNDFTPEGIM